MFEELLLSAPMIVPSLVSGVINFVQSSGVRAASGTFGVAVPEGDIAIVAAFDPTFYTSYHPPDSPTNGLWSTIYASPDSSATIGGVKVGYRVAPVGGLTVTDTWLNAQNVCWWTAHNARKTWAVNPTTVAVAQTALSANCIHASAAPDGVDEWVLTITCSGGNFVVPDYTSGNPTPVRRFRTATTLTGKTCAGIYDSNGAAVNSLGQTISAGYESWHSVSIKLKAGT